MPISPGLLLLELCTFWSLLPILSTLPLATPSLFSMSSHSFLNVYVAPKVAIIVDMGNNFSLHSISFETFPSLSSGSTPGFHSLACCHLKSISVMQKLCLIGLLVPRAQQTACISTDLPMPIKDGAPCCLTRVWNRRASLLEHRAGQQIGLQSLTSSGWQSNLGADIEEVIIRVKNELH